MKAVADAKVVFRSNDDARNRLVGLCHVRFHEAQVAQQVRRANSYELPQLTTEF